MNMEYMECPKCYAVNRKDANFCGVCCYPFCGYSPNEVDILFKDVINKKEVQKKEKQEKKSEDDVIIIKDKPPIQIGQENLKNRINKYTDIIKKNNDWIALLGIFITIFTTFVTSPFKNFGFPSYTWEKIFIFSGIGSFVIFVLAVINHFKIKKINADQFIKEIYKTYKEQIEENSCQKSKN